MTLSWFKIKALGKIAFYVLIVFFPIIVNCTETEPNIRSVFLYKSGWQLSYPILNLQKPDEKLVLSFDDLSAEFRDFQYRIVHCNANWKPSELSFFDYGYGLPEAYIINMEMSRNTLQRYVHYELKFPNNDMGFKISGNYLLQVFEDHTPNIILFEKKFFVFENKVLINANIQRSSNVELRSTHQEVDFTIKEINYNLTNPYQDLTVKVMQNFRTDNLVTLSPQFVKGTELEYNYDLENTFEGCNEFRFIDIRNSGGIINAQFLNPINGIRHLALYQDEKRSFNTHKNVPDINGRRLVMVNDLVFNDNLDADYFYTTFTLNYPYILPSGDLYIFGELSNWEFLEEFKLLFDAKNLVYKATPLLKQGYYNYLYLFKPNNQSIGECHWIEGSHYETENEYYILVYHKSAQNNYDALIGMYTTKFPQ